MRLAPERTERPVDRCAHDSAGAAQVHVMLQSTRWDVVPALATSSDHVVGAVLRPFMRWLHRQPGCVAAASADAARSLGSLKDM
jgi:hypothetical protein